MTYMENKDRMPGENISIMGKFELLYGTEATIHYYKGIAFKLRMGAGKNSTSPTKSLKKALFYEEKASELTQKLENGKGTQNKTK